MPVYVSMLRGINVGPHRRIKMDQLRRCLEALGFSGVSTYINSGNLIFKAGKSSTSALSKKIEEDLLSHFGFPIPVITRTALEMCQVVANNPFVDLPNIESDKLHIMFLSSNLSSVAQKNLERATQAPERSSCLGREIYLYLPNGVAESTLMKQPLDRILSVGNTTRNWKTVNNLLHMCEECQ